MSLNYDNSLSGIFLTPLSLRASNPEPSNQASRAAAGPDAPQARQDLLPFRVSLSDAALRKAGLLKDQPETAKTGAPAQKEPTSSNSSNPNDPKNRQLESLKQTDSEVRAHEQAHVAAGGGLVRGAASFGYATGPDGKMYAVSGEVSIDSSPVPEDPDATIHKMMQVARAALAPAQPSGQDRAVASAATKIEGQARQAAALQSSEKAQAAGKISPEKAQAAGKISPAPTRHINLQA